MWLPCNSLAHSTREAPGAQRIRSAGSLQHAQQLCPRCLTALTSLPPGPCHQTFVEELVRLPGCFLCYTPPADAPLVAPLPALGRGFVTFGSFNALAKITDEVLALWARVLAAVPGSRLVLKNKPFACAQARALWMARLGALGVDAWRVDLLPLAHTNAEHLAQYALLDVSLDPFPYAGEGAALWGCTLHAHASSV
jgi:predicted O-linked N-acetylglucosamine transferase (SPINDLY family)